MTRGRSPRVLGVHGGALGDVILFARLLEALGGSATLVARGETARLLAGLGVVAAARDFEALPLHECFSDTPAEQCRLPGLLGPCGRLISCFAAGRAEAEARLAALCGAADAAFLPVRPPAEFNGHLLGLWHNLLGLPAPRLEVPAWPVPAAWRRDAADALARAGADPAGPHVVLHPGAGARQKCWPVERFGALARELAADGWAPLFVLGPVEAERMDAEACAALAREFALLADVSLPVLAGVLAGARAFVGNDSGPAHLAAAVGAPTLALFGPTRPEHFAPVGPWVRTLRAGGGRMDALAVADVLRGLAELLR